MNEIDITIIIIVLISTIFGVMRGFLKEAIALLAWVLACVLALGYSEPVADMLSTTISHPVIRYISAFLLICIGTLVLVGLLRLMIKNVIEKGQLSNADRFLGFLFGAARGVTIVAILVYLFQTTEMAQKENWYTSELIPYFEEVSVTFISFIPSSDEFMPSKEGLNARTSPQIEDFVGP